jgi:hypothetical protein
MLGTKKPLGNNMLGSKMPLGKAMFGSKMPLLDIMDEKQIGQAVLDKKVPSGLERRVLKR